MNLKENCQYIFNKNNNFQTKKNSKNLIQDHYLKPSQTEACSILFQISNSETLQPLERKTANLDIKRDNPYSPWRQYKNSQVLAGQQKAKKNYLSTTKNPDQKTIHKKQKRELSMKVLSQLIQFPVSDQSVVQKFNKRCSYFQKCKTKEQNAKNNEIQTKSNNFNSGLAKVENVQSKSVQVLHLKKNEDYFRSAHKQKSVLILPNYKFFDNKPNITKEKFKMNILKRRLNKRGTKVSQSKEVKKQQNIDLILGNMLRQKLKNGILNKRDFPKDCATSKAQQQRLYQKINGQTKTQGIYKIK